MESREVAADPEVAEGQPAGEDGLHPWIRALDEGEILLVCDAPALDGGTPGEVSVPGRISGWAYSRAGVESVSLIIDDTDEISARTGLVRTDVSTALSERKALRSGFAAGIDTVAAPGALHVLRVRAVDAAGRVAEVSGEFTAVTVGELGARRIAQFPDELPPARMRLDNGGERYVPELHRGGSIEADHRARYVWAATLAAGRDVLDAGCGVGWGTRLLADAGARSVRGVDLDALAIGSAEQRAGDVARFVVGDLRSLPYEDDSFDLVVSFEAIEHVAEPQLALDEFRRVLRADGLLVVSTPNRGVYPDGNPFHLGELTSAELEAALRERFESVAIYRQQSHVGSLLTDDAGLELENPAVSTRMDVRKTCGSRPGTELYAIGLAGAGTLPVPEPVACFTGLLDVRAYFERIAELESRVLLSEAAQAAAQVDVQAIEREYAKSLAMIDAARQSSAFSEAARDEARAALAQAQARADDLQQRLASSERWLADHRNSLSWRITAPLRLAKRAALTRARRARAGR